MVEVEAVRLPEIDAMLQPARTRRWAEAMEREVSRRAYARTRSDATHARGYFDIPTETTLTAYLMGYLAGASSTKPVVRSRLATGVRLLRGVSK